MDEIRFCKYYEKLCDVEQEAYQMGIRDCMKALRICNYDIAYTPKEIMKILKQNE